MTACNGAMLEAYYNFFKKSRKQSPKSRKRFRLSEDRSTWLWKTY